VDYFNARYPNRNVEFMMAALYTYPTMICTFLSTLIVARFSLNARIRFGYLFFIPSLIAIPLLDLLLHNELISEDTGYGLTLMMILLVGIGCGGLRLADFFFFFFFLPCKTISPLFAVFSF